MIIYPTTIAAQSSTLRFSGGLFEAEILGVHADVDSITEKVDAWAVNDMLGIELYDAELTYFRSHHFANDELVDHSDFQGLQKSGRPIIVEVVIPFASNNARDRMLALLMIVLLLRTNLFQSARWSCAIEGQTDSFTQANAVLMRMLDRHSANLELRPLLSMAPSAQRHRLVKS